MSSGADPERIGDPVTNPPAGTVFAVAAGSLVLAVFGSAVTTLIAIAAFEGGDAKRASSSVTVLLFGQVGLWGGLIAGSMAMAKANGTPLRSFVGLRMRPFDVGWALLGPVLQFVISWLYAPFVSAEKVSEAARDLADRASGQQIPFLLLAIATCVGAPIVEEMFFRGFLYRMMAGDESRSLTARRTLIAISVTALVFGAFHFQPLLFPALTGFGVVCGVLRAKFGRLGPSIWLHVGFNTFTMVRLAVETFG